MARHADNSDNTDTDTVLAEQARVDGFSPREMNSKALILQNVTKITKKNKRVISSVTLAVER